MYRLSGPNIIFFIPLLIIGIFVVALAPHYLVQSRIVSLGSLLIGEIGLRFIPVIALFPKATLIQATALALIYMLTTIATCFAAWGINALGWPGEFSFLIKNDELNINTYALFISNIFSFFILVTNYRLKYDEELAKNRETPSKEKKRGIWDGLIKPRLNRPNFYEGASPPVQSTEKTKSQKTKSSSSTMDDEFWKPFEFEPELNKTSTNLPEESSGKLLAKESEIKETKKESDLFGNEELMLEESSSSYKTIEKPKPIKISPLPPSNIKEELTAIFEQYSSLDAVKKLTSSKSEKEIKRRPERESKKPYSLPKPQMSVKVQGEDIHEASFRHISEAEKIEEIKESLKKELEEELKSKIISGTTKEVQKDISEPKENIIESIQNMKEELIESLKSGFKKEFPPPVFSNKESENIHKKLKEINKHDLVTGSMYLNYNGNVLSEDWNEEVKLPDKTSKEISQFFNQTNKQINKTKQGALLHILLESKNGSLVVANHDDKLFAIQSKGTGEIYLGQLLRKLAELTETKG